MEVHARFKMNDNYDLEEQMEELKLSLELLRVLAWPLIVLYALVAFQRPLRAILEQLPAKLGQVDKVSVGSFSFEVREKLRAAGDAETGRALGKLTRGGFEMLVKLRDTSTLSSLVSTSTDRDGNRQLVMPDDREIDGLIQLEALGLLTFFIPLPDFLAKFKTLPGCVESLTPRRAFRVSEIALSPDQIEWARKQQYHLTDSGRRAYDAIFSSVVEQLKT